MESIRECDTETVRTVYGGDFSKQAIEAIGIAVQIYKGACMILDNNQHGLTEATEIYARLGSQIGEQLFNLMHPNPLGKMLYYPSDFAL